MQPTHIFALREFHSRYLVDHSPKGHNELDTSEQLNTRTDEVGSRDWAQGGAEL